LSSNNRTILSRGEKIIKDFSNTSDAEPLKHGDQISLGVKSRDSTLLLFEIRKTKTTF